MKKRSTRNHRLGFESLEKRELFYAGVLVTFETQTNGSIWMMIKDDPNETHNTAPTPPPSHNITITHNNSTNETRVHGTSTYFNGVNADVTNSSAISRIVMDTPNSGSTTLNIGTAGASNFTWSLSGVNIDTGEGTLGGNDTVNLVNLDIGYDVSVNTKGKDDGINITDVDIVRDSLTLWGGDGDDTMTLTRVTLEGLWTPTHTQDGHLAVHGGTGSDTLNMYTVAVQNNYTNILMGSGANDSGVDKVIFKLVDSYKSLNIELYAGTDTISVNSGATVSVVGNLTFDGGNDSDTLEILGTLTQSGGSKTENLEIGGF